VFAVVAAVAPPLLCGGTSSACGCGCCAIPAAVMAIWGSRQPEDGVETSSLCIGS
jgi:hypothetical protein